MFRFRAAHAGATDDDASAFVKLLLEAARHREAPLYVVLTMRSDFLGDCAQFQGLPEAINDGQYLIPRMTRDERRFAITGPVRVARARMSEPLVNRLLNDVGDNPDQLPILQHALMRTWDEWKTKRPEHEAAHTAGTLIDVCCYEAIGGMSDALSRHAEEAYNELPDERARHVAEHLFKALTERGTDNREIRRPMRLKEICEIAGATPEEVSAVVEVFRSEGRSFLMPPAGVALTPEIVIDISHESLIRNWARLQAWVRDEAEAARIYRRLADAAAAHRAGEAGLLDDVTLAWVNRWRERYTPNRAWGVRYHPEFDGALAYFEESRAEREKERAERERQRQELLERERREREQAEQHAAEQQKYARKFIFLARVLGFWVIVAVVALGGALYMTWRAWSAQGRVEIARQKLQKSRNASKLIQSYEMEKAERELGELYAMTATDTEGRENRAWVLYNLGELNSRLDSHERAAAFFESALQTEIMIHGRVGLDSVGTLNSLAYSQQEAGNYDAAASRLEQLLDLLTHATDRKDTYFRLNVANAHSDLADLYLARAGAVARASRAGLNDGGVSGAAPGDVEAQLKWTNDEAEKAIRHDDAAIAIWEEILKDDPEALADKYILVQSGWLKAGIAPDEVHVKRFARRSHELRSKVITPLKRKSIGQSNPGGDPAIMGQLAAEGPGYMLFNRLTENAYGRAELIDLVSKVAAEWAERHPDLKLIVGDLSLRGGGPFLAHGGDHQDGREADIWPVTNTGQPEPTNTYAPNYSRELTSELIQIIRQMNPRAVVYFDDPQLVSVGAMNSSLDHNNHLHVLLPGEDQ